MDGILKWLEGNPVGIALGTLCGVLLLALVGMMVISTFSSDPVADEIAAAEADVSVELPQMPENLPIDSYSVITERPLFNESRQPMMVDMGDSSLLADDESALNMGAPEVELRTLPSRRPTRTSYEARRSHEGRPCGCEERRARAGAARSG